MLSEEYKKKAMESLQNISAEELLSIFTEIGSVQMSESISVAISSIIKPFCVEPWNAFEDRRGGDWTKKWGNSPRFLVAW